MVYSPKTYGLTFIHARCGRICGLMNEHAITAPTTVTRLAGNFRKVRLLLFNALAVILADQATKWIVEARMSLYDSIPLIGHWFGFTHTRNYGAAFSMFQNGGMFFVVIAIVVSGLILYYAPRLPENDWLSRVALGLQMGGALGNVIDRLRRDEGGDFIDRLGQGYVTDFLHFKIPEINFDFPVFNIADSCIFIGVVILIVMSLRQQQQSG
jgi:signal peptidase II